MEEQLKNEQQELDKVNTTLESGRKQITHLEQQSILRQGRITMLNELIAAEKEKESEGE